MKNIIQLYFKVLSTIAPKIAGKHAFQLFQKPLNKKIRKKELPFYKLAKRFTIKSTPEDIHCYELGAPSGKTVLLVHGWESNAASMSAIALKLAEDGHHVILFNLPAHGFSKLEKANMKTCKEVFLQVVDHIKPDQPFSVVAHSFGSAVTAYSLSKTTYHVDHLIFLTSPNRLKDVFKDYGNFINLGKMALQHMNQLATNLLKEPLENVSVDLVGKKIRYNHLLLIHDQKDTVIAKTDSIEIYNQWDRSTLHLIEKSGHYRMLWDQNVINKISDTLNDESKEDLEKSPNFAMVF